MAPDPKEGLLVEHNLPLCKMPIRDDVQVSDIYDVEFRPFARGKFAQVKRCKHRVSGVEYAAKHIRRRRRSTDVSNEILHEIRVLMMSTKTNRIIQLHEVFATPTEYVLILELATGGELQRLLDDEEYLPEKQSARIVRQVLEAVSYLHERQIAHLDIKPQNILLTGSYPDCDTKLCDFGISRHIATGSDLREIVGTPDYVAPEILHYEPISLATDMWSIGCLTYVLLTGYSPFGADDKQTTFCNITQARVEFPETLFDGISPAAIDFIKKLLFKEPKKRISCVEALRHDWIVDMCSDVDLKPKIVNLNTSVGTLITPAVVVNNQQALTSPSITALAHEQSLVALTTVVASNNINYNVNVANNVNVLLPTVESPPRATTTSIESTTNVTVTSNTIINNNDHILSNADSDKENN